MGSPSHLLKKQDTYYFRQAWPKSVKAKIGKSEIVKSLGVKEKGLAIRIAREFKVNLDHVVDQLEAQAHADTIGTIQLLEASQARFCSRMKTGSFRSQLFFLCRISHSTRSSLTLNHCERHSPTLFFLQLSRIRLRKKSTSAQVRRNSSSLRAPVCK